MLVHVWFSCEVQITYNLSRCVFGGVGSVPWVACSSADRLFLFRVLFRGWKKTKIINKSAHNRSCHCRSTASSSHRWIRDLVAVNRFWDFWAEFFSPLFWPPFSATFFSFWLSSLKKNIQMIAQIYWKQTAIFNRLKITRCFGKNLPRLRSAWSLPWILGSLLNAGFSTTSL